MNAPEELFDETVKVPSHLQEVERVYTTFIPVKAGGEYKRLPPHTSAVGKIDGTVVFDDLWKFKPGTQIRVCGEEGVEYLAEVL